MTTYTGVWSREKVREFLEATAVRFLGADPAVAFEVSTNEPPYKGVRGRGTATVGPDEQKRVLRVLIMSVVAVYR